MYNLSLYRHLLWNNDIKPRAVNLSGDHLAPVAGCFHTSFMEINCRYHPGPQNCLTYHRKGTIRTIHTVSVSSSRPPARKQSFIMKCCTVMQEEGLNLFVTGPQSLQYNQWWASPCFFQKKCKQLLSYLNITSLRFKITLTSRSLIIRNIIQSPVGDLPRLLIPAARRLCPH